MVFNYDKKIEEKLNSKMMKTAISSIISALFPVFMVFVCKAYEFEESVQFFAIFLMIGGMTLALSLGAKEAKSISQIILNVQKNKLTLYDDKIHIVYVDEYTKVDSEKFIEINFSNIKNIEIVSQDIKTNEYCNLRIFTSLGMYKVSLENPNHVRNLIMQKANGKNGAQEDVQATHKWRCECGAEISKSPCSYCGKEYDSVEVINNKANENKTTRVGTCEFCGREAVLLRGYIVNGTEMGLCENCIKDTE